MAQMPSGQNVGEHTTGLDTPTDSSEDKEVVIVESAVKMDDDLTPNFVISLAKRWNAAFESFFGPEREKIEKYHRMARSQNTAKRRSQHSVVVPIADNIISTAKARLLPGLFSRERLVDAISENVLPTDPDDPNSSNSLINKIEDFINQTIVYTTDTRRKAEELVTEALISGTGIGRAFWTKRRIKRSVPVFEVDPATGAAFEVDTKPVFETKGHWDWESVPLFNMAWEPRATDLENATWLRQRSFKTLDQLKVMEKNKIISGVDAFVKKAPSSDSGEDWEEKRREDVSVSGTTSKSSEGTWQIDEFWATITWTDKKGNVHTQEAHFMVGENTYLLMYEENPLEPQRKPYFAFRYKIRPGEFLGSSILEAVEDLVEEINLNKGRLSDLTMKAAIQPLLVDETSGVDPRNLMSRTNGIIPVENVAGVKPLPIDGGSINATVSNLNQDIGLARESTASNEQSQGISGAAGTATEARILAGASGSLFSYTIMRAMDEWVTPMAQQAFWYYRQFGENGDMFVRKSSIDGKPMPVERRDLQNDIIFSPISPETMVQKADRVAKLMEMVTLLGNLGVQLPFLMNFVKNEILPLLDINNGKDIFPDEAGVPQMDERGGVPSMTAPNEASPRIEGS